MVIIKSRTTLILLFIYLFIWLLCTACGIIVPWLGIEPWPPAVKVQSPNHWTTREFPYYNDHPINTIIFILILSHEHELDVWSKQSPWADILHLELCKSSFLRKWPKNQELPVAEKSVRRMKLAFRRRRDPSCRERVIMGLWVFLFPKSRFCP